MKNQIKITVTGIAFLLAMLMLTPFVSATINAPAAGGPALSPSQISQEQITALQNTDSDEDGVSTYDEIYVYGTNPNAESTDGDAYDDGQELFGHSPANYGELGGQMPAYVKWPGNSPFVAAYPQIDFTVDNNFTVFIHKVLHFANRTMDSVERTTGTIVTTGVSSSYGVGGSHTTGNHQDKTNSEADHNYAGTSHSELNAKNTVTSQTDEHSQVRNAGWEVNGEAGFQNGLKATVGASYSDKTTTTDKTTKSTSTGTSASTENGQTKLSGTTMQKAETTGASQSSTITGTNSVTIQTSISSIDLYTVGTAKEWEEGWSQDTTDAAQLRFCFTLKNTGTDRASGITNLRFTVKIGPYTKTYPNIAQPGIILAALNPGEVVHYCGGQGNLDPLSLTLDELREYDTKGKTQIYIEDYDLGNSNEETYALRAFAGGTLFIVDDGSVEDGSNLQYFLAPIMPSGIGTTMEAYGDVLLRLNKTVPVGSPQYTTNALDISIVNETIAAIAGLPVSDNAAWFIQTEGISNNPFLFKEAKRGSKVIMTYSKDSDNDNYPDRAERIAGTNVNDLYSHPNPNVIAGYYIDNVALTMDNVTYEKTKPVFTLKPKIANTGNYDAYGAEIRLLATNSDIDITDNFAGGSVRVKPNETFVLNDALTWKPKAPGAKSNSNFILNNANIQVQYADNPEKLNDGTANGNPDLAAVCRGFLGVTGYQSPWLGDYKSCLIILPEGEVLYKINFFVPYQSATIIEVSQDNKSWTRIYNVEWPVYFNEVTFTEPIYAKYIRISGHSRRWIDGTALYVPFSLSEVELYRYEYSGKPVSAFRPIFEALYNDPQGPHRFISTTKISNENISIENYAGEMKRGLALAINRPEKLTYGQAADVEVIFANPASATFENGKVFVTYNLPNGTLLKAFQRAVPLGSGNTKVTFALNTAELGQQVIGSEVVVFAAAADSQGNAIAEEIETVEIENPVKILNYAPGDVPNPVPMQRNEVKQFAIFASAASQLTYKWFLDRVQIANANANTYSYRAGQIGNRTLKAEVTDGTYTNSHTWNIEVTGVANYPPVLEPIANITVTAGQDVIVKPVATDADNDTLSYIFSGQLNFTQLANLTFITTPHIAGTYPMSLTVSDGNGGAASQNFTVNVNAQPANNTTPMSFAITGLSEISKTDDSITWSWINPAAQFSHTEVWLNGIFRQNTTLNSITISGLTAATIYELGVRPVGTAGNFGNWVNDTAQTNSGSGGNTAQISSSGSGGSDSTPRCNIGYELVNGRCTLKQNTNLTRVDKNATISDDTPEKPQVNVAPQTANSEPQTDNSKGNMLTGFLTAVKSKVSLAAVAIIAALAAGYYLFTRKYDFKVEFGG